MLFKSARSRLSTVDPELLNNRMYKTLSSRQAPLIVARMMARNIFHHLFPQISAIIEKDAQWIIQQIGLLYDKQQATLPAIYLVFIVSALMNDSKLTFETLKNQNPFFKVCFARPFDIKLLIDFKANWKESHSNTPDVSGNRYSLYGKNSLPIMRGEPVAPGMTRVAR